MTNNMNKPRASRRTGAEVASGLMSGALLLLLVIGGAIALLRWGRLDVWRGITWSDIWQVQADASLLLGVMTVVGWLAWAMIAATVIFETMAALSHGRVRPHLPGGGFLRVAIGTLVLSTLGLAVAANGGGRLSTAIGDVVATPHESVHSDATVHAAVSEGTTEVRPYLVRSGDDLWSLAERFAGGGENWRTIADANATSMLDPGTNLVPGMMLLMPGESASSNVAASETITVKHGDTLWDLAKANLGDPMRWPDIYHANSGIIHDPNLIYPGQVLTLPGSGAGASSDDHDHDVPVVPGPTIDVSRPPTPPPDEQAQSQSVPDDQGSSDVTSEKVIDQQTNQMVWAVVGSIGSGLAAALLAGVATHRVIALRNRPLGRTLPRVDEATQRLETALDRLAAGKRVGPPLQPKRTGSHPGGPQSVTSVVLGRDDKGDDVVIDLAEVGLMAVTGNTDQASGLMSAIAGQLLAANGPDGPEVVLADPSLDWLARLLDCPMTPSAEAWRQVMVRLSDAPESEMADGVAAPMIVFISSGDVEASSLLRAGNSVTVITAIGDVAKHTPDEAPALDSTSLAGCAVDVVIELDSGGGAYLWPDRCPFMAQLVMPPAKQGLKVLVDSLSNADYPAAPWWGSSGAAPSSDVQKKLYIVGSNNAPAVADAVKGDERAMTDTEESVHPQLKLLGPVELVGARGVSPARAAKQCHEYCGWLLRYPGQTAATMAGSLLVAEGTRRSNMSRLRLWLGVDDDGKPYLPDAYSGRIRLHPDVTSDWELVQVLVSGGVQKASEAALIEALNLVRGAPLADAAPGQWHWAEEWRIDMVSLIRDIGVVLCTKALRRRDIDLARWSAARALMAAPEDDRLMMARLRTEHLAGNRAEVDRLAFHITRSSKMMGFDLSDGMVTLLQEVVEGAPRMRLAS